MKEISLVKSEVVLSDEITQHAERIGASWHKAAETIIEAGKYILEAERSLSYDDYGQLIEYLIGTVGISTSSISKLRVIARSPLMKNAENVSKLPPSFSTIYEIAQNKNRTKVVEALDTGKIHPSLTRDEVMSILSDEPTKPPEDSAPKGKTSEPSMDIKIVLKPTADAFPVDVVDELEQVLQNLKPYFEINTTGLKQWK